MRLVGKLARLKFNGMQESDQTSDHGGDRLSHRGDDQERLRTADRQGVAPVPAVIVGGQLNGLGVCRSLAKAGVPTHVIDEARFNAGMWSRYATPMRARSSGRPLLETLRLLSTTLGQAPVLIITDERAVLTISEFRDELAGLFRIPLPKHETARQGALSQIRNNQRFPSAASRGSAKAGRYFARKAVG